MSTTPTEIIEAIRKECAGSIVWRVADPDGAYCIEFDRHSSISPERDCREWFAGQQRKFHGWAEENQYQVIEARWFSTAEQLAKHAAAALSEALAQLEAERARNAATWLPMGTAPKDGTEVLLDLPLDKSRARRAVIGHYMKGGHCIEDHPAIDRGWYFWTGRMFDKAPDPAGWMRLPPPLAIIPGALP